MKQLLFWNRWNREHRLLYLFFLGIFIFSWFFFFISYAIGNSAVIHWDVSTAMEPFMVVVDRFTQNLFDYSVEAESYILKETYYASDVKVNLSPSYIFFVFIVSATLAGIVVSTFLNSFAYFIGTGLLMLFIVTLNLDLLNILGYQNKIPAVALILLLCSLSYYFKSFRPEASFTQRLCAFALLFLFCGIGVAYTSTVPAPVLYITNFGITVPIILTLVFIAINGFENINLFLYLSAGSSNTPDNKSRIINFTIISLLYLSNILLMLLKKMLFIDWNILYINAFYLYFVSSVIGIWGYKKRAVIFKDMLPFNPLGGLFYLALGIIANATITYAFITGNDPLSECFEYGIIYSHVFFGGIYFLYILINFGALFSKKISIYEIVYKPLNLPFFMVRGVSGAGILAIFLYSNNFAMYLGLAGYHNLGGDVYKYEHNLPLAKQYYLSGVRYEHQNHRSNYALAGIYETENNREKQAEYYAGSLVKRPFEYSYINLGNLYLKENAYFQAMFIVKEGLEKFPESTYLANNLAMLYMRTELLDSIFYYLDKSIEYNKSKAVPLTNYIYTILKKDKLHYADTLLSNRDFIGDLSFESNKLLLQNILHKKDTVNTPAPVKIDSLKPVSFAFLYNLALNKLKNSEKNSEVKNIDSLLLHPANEAFRDALQLLKVMKLYYAGEKKDAFVQLENLKNNSSNIYFSKIAGVWLVEQEAYVPAAENFYTTINSGGASALLNYCMALCESGKFTEAAPFLEDLKKSGQPEIRGLAAELSDITLVTETKEILKWPEIKKLRYIHLQKSHATDAQLLEIFYTLKSENFSLMGAAAIIESLIQKNKLAAAEEFYNSISVNKQGTTYADGMLNLARLKLLAADQNWKALKNITSKVFLNPDKENLRSYFMACAAEGTLDNKTARILFEQSLREAPFHEDAIIHSVSFYNKIHNPSRAYDIISEAVQFYPSSIPLLEAFVLQARRNNLESYAEDALAQLKALLKPEDYKIFKTAYDLTDQKMQAQ